MVSRWIASPRSSRCQKAAQRRGGPSLWSEDDSQKSKKFSNGFVWPVHARRPKVDHLWRSAELSSRALQRHQQHGAL